ncbi:MAG: GIY-YIG nuclease family protein [Thermoflavifilum sp.]|nr:GIY-YIG nuclease family protein [Thermoflavifilum sp.]
MSIVSGAYYVYVLRSEHCDRMYIGITSDIARRLAEHNGG